MAPADHPCGPRNIRLTLEYDGTGLAGWQRQAQDPTVQATWKPPCPPGRRPITVIGRAAPTPESTPGPGANFHTRSGYSAEFQRGGNALLPEAIAILKAEEVPADFHARTAPKARLHYDLWLSPSVRPCAGILSGTCRPAGHGPDGTGPVRPDRPPRFRLFPVTGSSVENHVRTLTRGPPDPARTGPAPHHPDRDGFLRHMVRAVAEPWDVGRGRLSPRSSGYRQVGIGPAGATAPARGLCLREVIY
jgi:tRNA pseudouridine38-40 synthase